MKYFITLMLFFSYSFAIAEIKTKYLLVNKSNRQLLIFFDNGEVKDFSISLGFEPYGTKVKKGDGKTPEGLYFIEKKIVDSAFHLALQISYPNPWDIRRALSLNNIQADK